MSIPGLSVIDGNKLAVSVNGISELVRIAPDDIAGLLAPVPNQEGITLNKMLIAIGCRSDEIGKWRTPDRNGVYPSRITEDAISVILFYCAHLIDNTERTEKARWLCQIIVNYGLRSTLKVIMSKSDSKILRYEEGPDPATIEVIAFLSLVEICKHLRPIERIRSYVDGCLGVNTITQTKEVRTDSMFDECLKNSDILLDTTDLWFDHDERSYITLTGASSLIGVDAEEITRIIKTLSLGGMGLSAKTKRLAESGVSRDEMRIWLRTGVLPGDALYDIASIYAANKSHSKAKSVKELIDKHGVKNFLLSRAIKATLNGNVIISVKPKPNQDDYFEIYRTRLVVHSHPPRLLSTKTLWVDEQGKYRMSWSGIAQELRSNKKTLKDMLVRRDESDSDCLRMEIQRIGYTEDQISEILTTRAGVPEDIIDLLVRHYSARKGVNKEKSRLLEKMTEENDIRSFLDERVQKTVSREGTYIPARRKRRIKKIPLKYGDVD